jgi:tetratricopeptide (TPR) repeat protein
METGYQDPYVFYALIEQDRAVGDKEAGLRDFVSFSQRFPDSPWLHVLLGDAHLPREEDSAAQSEYQQALTQDPAIPVVHFKLGYIAFKLGEYSEAADHFRREIAVDPGFSEAYLYLGAALHRLGKTREAVPFLEQAVTHEPTTVLAYRELAVAQLSTRPLTPRSSLRRSPTKNPPLRRSCRARTLIFSAPLASALTIVTWNVPPRR